MDETIRTAAISPLRQRLIDDMNLRRFSRATQHSYIRDVGRFATFLGRSPDTATADDVRGGRLGLNSVSVPIDGFPTDPFHRLPLRGVV
jgi:integrase/recombinase XerD